MLGTGISNLAPFNLFGVSSPISGLLHNVLITLAVVLGVIVFASFIITRILKLFLK